MVISGEGEELSGVVRETTNITLSISFEVNILIRGSP
jgi:hypothetical protein